MNHTTLNAGSAMNQCEKFTAHLVSNSKVPGFIQRINSATRSSQGAKNIGSDLRLSHFNVITNLTKAVHLRLEAFEGFRANRLRLVRSVATVIGIGLSMALMPRLEASIVPNKSITSLADYQLTDKQYKCHNAIIYKESRWDLSAVNGSHYGLYQGRSISLKGAPAEYQFWWYWYYVTNRYGVTKYDEPNYCNALHHLRTHGWQ